MEYNVFHMQLWAKESHEKAILLQQEREQQILQTQRREAQRKKEMDRLEYYAKDSENLKKDIEETQALQKTMRQCGIKPGVNAITHQLPPQEQLETTRFLSFKLRDDVNLEWKLKHQRTPDILMPFDIDLKLYRDVETLRGVNIGERGALALASEFVRGACSNLLTLDLSRYDLTLVVITFASHRCQIHSRGFSRVLHGLRMGRVLNLQSLKVRGNSLTPSAVEYLKAGHTSSY